ncbi:MAG: caspase family protein [Acidobacteriota bacterium]
MRTALEALAAAAFVLFTAACSPGASSAPDPPAQTGARPTSDCPKGAAVASDGIRRLALVVGVGEYANPSVSDLPGPPNDAQRIYQLLTDEASGYGFPRSNVCLLLDEQATTAGFRQAFEQGLIARAEAGDVAVIYFAGHGAQTPDENGDESDGQDETLLFHDARTGDVGDLIDDEFHRLLTRLHRRTQRVTVILDSCTSASATRATGNAFTARFQPPAVARDHVLVAGDDTSRESDIGDDSAASWLPRDLPGVVTFSAASDNTPALERAGSGIFTDALLQVLSAHGGQPLSYAQAARRIRPLVAARSHQIPYFQGDLDSMVFADRSRRRPTAWEVTAVEPRLLLAGPPLPGMGAGAELRIYDGASTARAVRDPAGSKATVTVLGSGDGGSEEPVTAFNSTALNVTAQIIATPAGASEIREGDLAVLVRPSDDFVELRVRIRPAREPGGVPRADAERLRAAVSGHPEAALLVQLTEQAGDFELSRQPSGDLGLWGPHRLRETYRAEGSRLARQVAASLWRHARQKALLALQGEGGDDFRDQETLEVSLVPANRQTICARGEWRAAAAGGEQAIPLCQRWHVKVRLSAESPLPLLVGGLVLSTDGGIATFPDGASSAVGSPDSHRQVKLAPGSEHIFRDTLFEARPPLDVQDKVMVFGTQESNPVAWHLLAATADSRSGSSAPRSPLFRALDRYLRPATRTQARVEEDADFADTTWTLTTTTLRVVGGGTASAGLSPQRDWKTICDPRSRCGAP